jgi:hypothetical protein
VSTAIEKAIYNVTNNAQGIRYQVWPDNAAGVDVVNAVADGAWVWTTVATSINVIAAANIGNPCWLMGFTILACTWGPGVYGDVRLGRGALGGEVWLATMPVLAGAETPVGLGGKMPVWLPVPIKITGSPRLCASVRSLAGGILGVTIKVITTTGLGT